MTKQLKINKSWCKGCGICAAFCPKGHLEVVNGAICIKENTGCVLCGACEMRCPDYAIYIEESEDR